MALVGDLTTSLPSHGNFQHICTVQACDLIPVHKYQSSVSGLTVLIAEVEGPVVNGYFCLATEAHDDDGLPHTLEHLIFLGSERYPYKGVMDCLTNRCLASGTNAWTDVDHTCYTLTSAGSKGFLSLLPVYLDHILFPTLNDSGFITEVHHITGDGEDGGVVYNEMQAREELGEPLLHIALLRQLYPGKCGYTFEAGGLLKNLRESTDNTKVRSYHTQFYRPENLTLIITGHVTPEDVFKSLGVVEESIASKGDRGDFSRPWQDALPALEQSQSIEVLYPSDEEDHGMVYVGWRGPSIVTDLYTMQACSMLLKYLTETSVSPIQKEFVAIDDRYASNIAFSICENSESALYLLFEKVPADKLDKIQPRLADTLSKIDHFDMTRLKTIIHQHILEVLSQLENSPHETLATFLIVDSIYGRTKESLNQHLNGVSHLKAMENEPESFWLNLFQKYLVSAPQITVRGKPSREKHQQNADAEMKRVQEQKAGLGEEGLKELTVKLLQATEKNYSQQFPEDLINSVPIQTPDSVDFHLIKTFTTTSEEQHPFFDLAQVPVTMFLNHVHTNFIYMNVLLDTSGISIELKDYLPLYLEALLQLPVMRGDVLVKHEDVTAELSSDAVCVGSLVGLETSDRFTCGPYAHTANLLIQLEPAKYERCIVWIRELLYQTQITAERLREIGKKIVEEVTQAKHKGHRVIGDLMKGLCFNKESNFHSACMFRQQKFITALMEKMDTDEGSKQVLSDIETLRSTLTDPARMVVHLAADVDRLVHTHADAAAMWAQILPEDKQAVKSQLAVIPDWKMLYAPSESPLPSCIVGLEGEESCFFSQTCPCIQDFNDPDLAPLLVFLQYITQLEGPMWHQILGSGLACLYQIMPRPNEGLLHMGFYWATECVTAYQIAKEIFEAHMADNVEWNPTLLEWARRSLTFEVIQREKSVGEMVTQSLLSFFKGVDAEYKRNLMCSIAKVTPDDLVRVGRKYVSALFDPTKVKTAIVCNPSKSADIAEALEKMDHKLTIFSSPEESFLSQ